MEMKVKFSIVDEVNFVKYPVWKKQCYHACKYSSMLHSMLNNLFWNFILECMSYLCIHLFVVRQEPIHVASFSWIAVDI